VALLITLEPVKIYRPSRALTYYKYPELISIVSGHWFPRLETPDYSKIAFPRWLLPFFLFLHFSLVFTSAFPVSYYKKSWRWSLVLLWSRILHDKVDGKDVFVDEYIYI
jgi:hypothetical protein